MCLQVALAALEVTNALVSNDVRILEASCLMGLVPAVLRYAYPIQPLLLRTQAAAFAHALCHGSAATARMFVACQVCFQPSPAGLHRRSKGAHDCMFDFLALVMRVIPISSHLWHCTGCCRGSRGFQGKNHQCA